MFVDGVLPQCYYEKATSLHNEIERILDNLSNDRMVCTAGRLRNVEVKMTEVFQNQQLTYELIAALFGEERIEDDE